MQSNEITQARETLRLVPYLFGICVVIWLMCLSAPIAPVRLVMWMVALGMLNVLVLLLSWKWRNRWLRLLLPILPVFFFGFSPTSGLPLTTGIQAAVCMGLTMFGLVWLFRPVIIRFCRLEVPNMHQDSKPLRK